MATYTSLQQSNGNADARSRSMRVFTDIPSFTCPFTASPSVCTPNEASSSTSPSKFMSFPKQHVPASSYSTDSELLSDIESRLCSPSLLTSLFLRNPSSCSTSTSDQATPLTPTGSRPILRRPECTSASTSASEDGGRLACDKIGLGLSSVRPEGVLARKRSTLTFAVKCPVTSDSTHSPPSSFCRPTRNLARSPARLPVWNVNEDEEDEEEDDEDDDEDEYREYSSPLFDEGSESDDEGYQEDSEGGFTDDEDLIGTFTGLPQSQWVPSARWTATQSSAPRRRVTQDTSLPTSDDGSVIYQPRGRKISIATTKPDRCSRHVSPPPSRAPTPPPPCPPAARSPSAIGLCRRRQTTEVPMVASKGMERRLGEPSSMHLAPPGRSASMSKTGTPQAKFSCPPTSILRNVSSKVCRRIPEKADLKLQRRVSAPACSNVVAARSTAEQDIGRGAKEGLEAFLRRGSECRPIQQHTA